MIKSISEFSSLLETLARKARDVGLTDSEWATRAAIRKETLSRLKTRRSCDFSTLQALAQVVGASIGVFEQEVVQSTPDGLFPLRVDRDYEEKLQQLCSSTDLDPARWRLLGPSFFMAGVAVMLASVSGFDRRGLLELAERLHAGMSQVGVFALWLERNPLDPSRFLPPLADRRHAA